MMCSILLFGISAEYNSDTMNIQNLRYFAIVAKLENVSRAADAYLAVFNFKEHFYA